jgi:hypothetical protein
LQSGPSGRESSAWRWRAFTNHGVMSGGSRRQEGRTRPEGSRARTRQGCRPRRRQAAESLEKHTGTIGRAIGRGVRRTGAALKRGWQKLKLRTTSTTALAIVFRRSPIFLAVSTDRRIATVRAACSKRMYLDAGEGALSCQADWWISPVLVREAPVPNVAADRRHIGCEATAGMRGLCRSSRGKHPEQSGPAPVNRRHRPT